MMGLEEIALWNKQVVAKAAAEKATLAAKAAKSDNRTVVNVAGTVLPRK